MPHRIDNITLPSKHNNKRISLDVQIPSETGNYPTIIFCHGFKGFKDWGHFNLISDYFANKGFICVKINFSHNGTTPENPIDFVDLEAFGNNNFSIELDDLDVLLNNIFSKERPLIPQVDIRNIFLLGHSKGGSTAIIKTVEDERIKGLVTWAAVCNIYNRYSSDEMGDWKKNGVQYIYNARTDQQMPLFYQLAEDVINNKDRFDIANIVKDLNKPYLIVHGTADETVDISEAQTLFENSPNANLEVIEAAGHTFDGSHPWESDNLPEATKIACKKTIEFLGSIV